LGDRLGRHFTNGQAMAFCECPRKYYYRYIRREAPSYPYVKVQDILLKRGLMAFLKNERRVLEEVGSIEDLGSAYDSCMDLAVATSISRTSRLLEGVDFDKIEEFIVKRLGPFANLRQERARRHMEEYGIAGLELGIIAYPPEDIERRLVDFKHRISGRVSLIKRYPGAVLPLHVSENVLVRDSMNKGEEMVAKMNALMVSEETGMEVAMSAVHFIKLQRDVLVPICGSNKAEVMSFSEFVKGVENFERSFVGCDMCEFREVCNDDGDSDRPL